MLEINKICISTVLTLLSVFISQFHSKVRGICLVLTPGRGRNTNFCGGGGGGGGGGCHFCGWGFEGKAWFNITCYIAKAKKLILTNPCTMQQFP